MAPRKKAVKAIPEEPLSNSVNPLEDQKPVETVETKKPKKERKTKKYDVIAVVTPEGIQGNLQVETRKPLIAHLPIRSSDVKFHDQPLVYDPSIPQNPVAFDASVVDPFSAEAMYEVQEGAETLPVPSFISKAGDDAEVEIKEKDKDTALSVQKKSQQAVPAGNTRLLAEFATSKQTKTLPSETSIACFWCCEQYEGQPCAIPTGLIDEIWQVYGAFCSPQCCLAYILSENLDTHVRWERIAMLNSIYGPQCNGRVYPAPNRECLQRFGGPMSSEEFKSIVQGQRVRVDVHVPPMVSILASMDTKPIDFFETNTQTKHLNITNYTPTYTAEEGSGGGLKLKRSKPLKDKESTLDSCLNIMVKQKPVSGK